jgi:hypothetical protein
MENDGRGVPQVSSPLGTPAVENQLRKVLWKSIKSSGVPRDEITKLMTRTLGRSVTPTMLADFIRSPRGKRGFRFPAAWVPAFCAATGNYELALFLLPEQMKHDLEVGQWARESRWVLERVRAKVADAPKPKSRPGLRRKR